MTKFTLFTALVNKGSSLTLVTTADGRTVNMLIRSIERESGDGRCFNVTGTDGAGSKPFTVFIKTID